MTFLKCTTFLLLLLSVLLCGCNTVRDHVLYDDHPANNADDARIEVPHLITVLSVDDAKLASDSLLPYVYTRVLRLSPGPHTLALRYEIIYETRAGAHTKFSTATTRVHTNFAPRASYRLVYDDPWTDRMADHPSQVDVNIRLDQLTPGDPAQTLEPTPEPTPAQTPEPQASGALTPQADSRDDASRTALGTEPSTPTGLEDLKHAWQHASPDERTEFQSWMGEHNK